MAKAKPKTVARLRGKLKQVIPAVRRADTLINYFDQPAGQRVLMVRGST